MRRLALPRAVPRPRLLALTLVAAALLGLGSLSPVFAGLAAVLFAAAIVLAVADYRLAPALGPAQVARVAAPQLIIGAPNAIGLALRNPTARPLRLHAVEAAVVGHPRNEQTAALAGRIAVQGAQALRYNGYKIPLMRNLVKRAIRGGGGGTWTS